MYLAMASITGSTIMQPAMISIPFNAVALVADAVMRSPFVPVSDVDQSREAITTLGDCKNRRPAEGIGRPSGSSKMRP